MSELVLECLSRPGPEMAAHSVDFLLMANTGGEVGGWGRVVRAAGGHTCSSPGVLAGSTSRTKHAVCCSPLHSTQCPTNCPLPAHCPTPRLAVSLSERPPALRQPLYEVTLQRLVPHASFPQHFTSWSEEFELDEDAFKRLRWVDWLGRSWPWWADRLGFLPSGACLACFVASRWQRCTHLHVVMSCEH